VRKKKIEQNVKDRRERVKSEREKVKMRRERREREEVDIKEK